jgi:antitoxin (DNA-binding transcriptional repressor) of toxin-antitoxin stability system
LAIDVKHVIVHRMATMTVRDVRLRWPEAERILAREGEIVVTRDAKPVARILPYRSPRMARRKRFDSTQHAAWLRRFWKSQPTQPRTDDLLRRERAE